MVAHPPKSGVAMRRKLYEVAQASQATSVHSNLEEATAAAGASYKLTWRDLTSGRPVEDSA
jgi:hypothetical protein